jgi:hypothetical protein
MRYLLKKRVDTLVIIHIIFIQLSLDPSTSYIADISEAMTELPTPTQAK